MNKHLTNSMLFGMFRFIGDCLSVWSCHNSDRSNTEKTPGNIYTIILNRRIKAEIDKTFNKEIIATAEIVLTTFPLIAVNWQ